MSKYFTITPRDTLISRDGRPFGAGAGNRMRSLDWIQPSVAAGAFRTMVGKNWGGNFSSEEISKLKNIQVWGPLPYWKEQLYFPKPADCVVRQDNGNVFTARPCELEHGEGTDLPVGLKPVQIDATEDFKPAVTPQFWSTSAMERWLLQNQGFTVPLNADNKEFIDLPQKDIRMHVKIDSEKNTSADGMLFQTTGLDFSKDHGAAVLQLAIQTDYSEGPLLSALDTLGGERRLVSWGETPDGGAKWVCPQRLSQALTDTKRVRMVLATPAIFSAGWKPGWLTNELTGRPPYCKDLELKLVGAAVSRWLPISGWSLEKGKTGEKPVRRLVPAGSVYFFEVIRGNAQELASAWLTPVSDEKQDSNDGFGLSLWGIW